MIPFASTHHYLSLSTQLLAIALHCMWLFPPSGQVYIWFLFTVQNSMQINMNSSDNVIQKQQPRPKKSDIFNLRSEPAVCSDRPDTILLLLLLSGRGQAPLLNAPVLTSIMTVSRIEKAETDFIQHTLMTHSLSEVTSDATHPKHFKGDANITLPPRIHYLRRTVAWY